MVQEHPSLVQAASYIAAAIAKEGGGEGPSSRHNPSLLVGDEYESDDELRGMEPGVRFTFCHVHLLFIKKDLIFFTSILPLSRLFPIYKNMLFYALFSF